LGFTVHLAALFGTRGGRGRGSVVAGAGVSGGSRFLPEESAKTSTRFLRGGGSAGHYRLHLGRRVAKVQGWGSSVWGSEHRVWGLGLRV
jgi:hypothetical protein